jgi:uncharacterized protein (DUF2141 family)
MLMLPSSILKYRFNFGLSKRFFTRFERVLLLILIPSLIGCANIQPPPGGPEDKDSPFVDTTQIPFGTTRFMGKSIWLHFNEYVEKSRVIESISLSPEKRLEYNWSGKELEILFAENLDSNTTYSLTLGTDWADLRGNKPKESYSLIFTTGTTLDSGVIKGSVTTPQPSGLMVLLYPLTGINPDTLDIRHTKARYKLQTGTSGRFEFKALPSGKYRLVAIKDEAKNGLYDAGQDAFGTTSNEVEVLPDTSKNLSAQLKPTDKEYTISVLPPKDMQAPELTDARPRSRNRIEAVFSENIDTLSLTTSWFVLSDSSRSKKVSALGTFINPSNPKSVVVLFPIFDSLNVLKLNVQSDSSGMKDKSGNGIPDSASAQLFTPDYTADTLNPRLLTTPFKDSTKAISVLPSLRFTFNDAIKREDIETKIGLYKVQPSLQKISTTISWRGDNEFELSPSDSLASFSWYEIRFKMNGVRNALQKTLPDSLLKIRFQTQDVRELGAISGSLIDSVSSTSKPQSYIITATNKKTGYTVRKTLKTPSVFSFTRLPEGDYSLECFADSNGNGEFDSGSAFPYSFAERSTVRSQLVNVKSRWTVEDVLIKFQK